MAAAGGPPPAAPGGTPTRTGATLNVGQRGPLDPLDPTVPPVVPLGPGPGPTPVVPTTPSNRALSTAAAEERPIKFPEVPFFSSEDGHKDLPFTRFIKMLMMFGVLPGAAENFKNFVVNTVTGAAYTALYVGAAVTRHKDAAEYYYNEALNNDGTLLAIGHAFLGVVGSVFSGEYAAHHFGAVGSILRSGNHIAANAFSGVTNITFEGQTLERQKVEYMNANFGSDVYSTFGIINRQQTGAVDAHGNMQSPAQMPYTAVTNLQQMITQRRTQANTAQQAATVPGQLTARAATLSAEADDLERRLISTALPRAIAAAQRTGNVQLAADYAAQIQASQAVLNRATGTLPANAPPIRNVPFAPIIDQPSEAVLTSLTPDEMGRLTQSQRGMVSATTVLDQERQMRRALAGPSLFDRVIGSKAYRAEQRLATDLRELDKELVRREVDGQDRTDALMRGMQRMTERNILNARRKIARRDPESAQLPRIDPIDPIVFVAELLRQPPAPAGAAPLPAAPGAGMPAAGAPARAAPGAAPGAPPAANGAQMTVTLERTGTVSGPLLVLDPRIPGVVPPPASSSVAPLNAAARAANLPLDARAPAAPAGGGGARRVVPVDEPPDGGGARAPGVDLGSV